MNVLLFESDMDTWTGSTDTPPEGQSSSHLPGSCRRVDCEGENHGRVPGDSQRFMAGKNEVCLKDVSKWPPYDVTFSWSCHICWTKKWIFIGVFETMRHRKTAFCWRVDKRQRLYFLFSTSNCIWDALRVGNIAGIGWHVAFHGCIGHHCLFCQDLGLPGLQAGMCEKWNIWRDCGVLMDIFSNLEYHLTLYSNWM